MGLALWRKGGLRILEGEGEGMGALESLGVGLRPGSKTEEGQWVGKTIYNPESGLGIVIGQGA